MSYYSRSELVDMGFAYVGRMVKVSTRAAIYDAERISIGDHSRIDDFCVISGNVSIGRNVHVAPFCLVAGGEPGITLHDFAGLAYHVQIFSQSDDYTGATLTNPTIPKAFKREIKAAVSLHRHVIVGAGSLVFPGVDVAEGCSIGALSLVTKSTLPWGIYVGNPARRIKDRAKEMLVLEQEYLSSAASYE